MGTYCLDGGGSLYGKSKRPIFYASAIAGAAVAIVDPPSHNIMHLCQQYITTCEPNSMAWSMNVRSH